jgi:hypothetical protein
MEKSHDKGMSEVADIIPPKGNLNYLGGFLVLNIDKCSMLSEMARLTGKNKANRKKEAENHGKSRYINRGSSSHCSC